MSTISAPPRRTIAPPRASLLAELAIYAGPFGVAAAESRTDAEIASILRSLRTVALAEQADK